MKHNQPGYVIFLEPYGLMFRVRSYCAKTSVKMTSRKVGIIVFTLRDVKLHIKVMSPLQSLSVNGPLPE